MDGFLFDSLLSNTSATPLVFVLSLLYAAINAQLSQPEQKIALVYILCILFVLVGAIESTLAIVGCLASTFLILEVFSSDEKLIKLFNFHQKVIDWSFQMLFTFHFALFALFVFAATWVTNGLEAPFAEQLIGFLLIAPLASLVCRSKFSRLSISKMLRTLTGAAGDPAMCNFSDAEWSKISILIHLEDRGFLSRDERQHTIFSWVQAKRGLRLARKQLTQLFRASFTELRVRVRPYIRGYSTIQMQLLRNIGLDHGSYQYTKRRKVFEVMYSNLFFNSYIDSLSIASPARQNIKTWILKAYLRVAPVKIGSRVIKPGKHSTFSQLFDREFEELTREEFFVWCLGLPQYDLGVGPNAVELHQEAIGELALDRNGIYEAIDAARQSDSKI